MRTAWRLHLLLLFYPSLCSGSPNVRYEQRASQEIIKIQNISFIEMFTVPKQLPSSG
jgi:hypothetical protein